MSRKREPAIGALVGIVTGLISGATGVFVVPAVPFLQAMDLGRDELVQAIAISAFVSAAALALGLGLHGGLGLDIALPASVALAAALVGMALGQMVRSRLSLETFRRWVLVGLIGLGGVMVARELL